MTKSKPDSQRPQLAVSKSEAQAKVLAQIEKAKLLPPHASVNENDGARLWYDFTEELLRQLFTNDVVTDEFTGRSSISFGEDISVAHYNKKLLSIYERLDLYPEPITTSLPSNTTNHLDSIENLIKKFHRVARQLRTRYDGRQTLDITDEYDVQDLFHALLVIHFDDIRKEEWTPSYAGGSSRMDFLLKSQRIVIEIKKTRPKLGAKELGEQLAVDILRYKSHPDCKTLICFIYDPEERVTNVKGFEHDLNQQIGTIQVKVYVVQR
ncbi:MAG: hypothetical protein V1799_10220 [bacterium]